MDIFDASDFDFLVPRRVRKTIAVGLLMGLAFVPPVQHWYVDQIQRHAEHLTRSIVKQLTPTLSPSPAHEGR
jgi:hypothetical protein